MERKIISKKIGDLINIGTRDIATYGTLYTEIDVIIKQLIELKSIGATHVYVDGESEYDSSSIESVEIHGVVNTIESDESFFKRQEQVDENAEYSRKHLEFIERAQYEMLKKKFDGV